MERKKTERKNENKISTAGAENRIGTRGRIFEGRVIKKFPKRITISFEKMTYVPKYERYSKSRTRIHARVPAEMENDIKIGDLIQIQECRPLSKIIHFIVIKKIKDAEEIK